MIAIIDYKLGNVGSLLNAFKKLQVAAVVTDNKNEIERAKLIVLPGVGAAGEGMKNLMKNGLDDTLRTELQKGKPFLGICLGMQLLFEKSEEGNTDCLGVLNGKVVKFQKERKIPQIGWNEVEMKNKKGKTLFKNIKNKSYFYFVNSYYCNSSDKSIIVGESEYGESFPSVIVKNNIVGTQFHPEKSGAVGFQLLQNIIQLNGV